MTLMIDQNFTKNCESRPDGVLVQYLILHYTGCPARVATARFLDHTPNLQGGRLSTHYMVDENGRITQFVHEKMRAWHAGKSYWRGETDMNSASIGIEIVNMGEYGGYPDFNPDQIAVVIDLCRDIFTRHPGITPFGVLGHSDIAPGRKLDPGPKFPWARLADAGVGVLPGLCHPGNAKSVIRDPRPFDPDAPHSNAPHSNAPHSNVPHPSPLPVNGERGQTVLSALTHPDLDQLLTEFGYNPDAPFDDRWDAFCTHYAPEGLREDGGMAAAEKLRGMVTTVQGIGLDNQV